MKEFRVIDPTRRGIWKLCDSREAAEMFYENGTSQNFDPRTPRTIQSRPIGGDASEWQDEE